jgi:hypothetical protein
MSGQGGRLHARKIGQVCGQFGPPPRGRRLNHGFTWQDCNGMVAPGWRKLFESKALKILQALSRSKAAPEPAADSVIPLPSLYLCASMFLQKLICKTDPKLGTSKSQLLGSAFLPGNGFAIIVP